MEIETIKWLLEVANETGQRPEVMLKSIRGIEIDTPPKRRAVGGGRFRNLTEDSDRKLSPALRTYIIEEVEVWN